MSLNVPNQIIKSAPPSHNAFWIAWIAVLVAAGCIRLYQLGSYPQKFTQDEMVLGYDAFSLWHTGRDHHGALLPMNFQSFNDFVPPVSIYLTVPFVGALGLGEFTTRLPFALLGTATVGLVGLLGRRWFGNLGGIVAALFLTIDPWHVSYSRLALPNSSMPFFVVAGLYAFTRAVEGLADLDEGDPLYRHWAWLVASAIAFALLTGCYPTMKIQGPIMVGICLLGAWRVFSKQRRVAIVWLVIYLLCVSPLAISQVLDWHNTQLRFSQISAFQDVDWFIQAMRLFVDHFSPGALFFSGFGNGEAVRRPLYIGELFWLEAPLWIMAFIGISQRSVSRRVALSVPLILTLWLLTYPLADSLTRGAPPFENGMAGIPHELRSYNFVPLPELLAGLGAVVLYSKLRPLRWGKYAVALVTIAGAAIGILFSIISLSYFFGPPILTTSAGPDLVPLNQGFGTVINQMASKVRPCDSIWLQAANQIYIYYLFYTQYPPAETQKFDLTRLDGPWLDIHDFGQVHVGDPNFTNPSPSSRPDCQGQPQTAYYVTRSSNDWPGWQEQTAVRNELGTPIWRLLVKRERFFTDGRLNDGDADQTMTGYCLGDGSLQVWAVNGAEKHPLFTLSAQALQDAIKQAASDQKHILIAEQEGRQLWALESGELQFHDARGAPYDYLFDGGSCHLR